LGKSVHLNRPGKKDNSSFGLPPIEVTKTNNKKSRISRTPYPPIGGAHAATEAQNSDPSPLIHPKKDSTPQIEI